MSIDKVYPSFDAAVADVPDGAVIMLGGWGSTGDTAMNLLKALAKQGAKELTIICNNGGIADLRGWKQGAKEWIDAAILHQNKQVKKVIASVPLTAWPGLRGIVYNRWKAGEFEVEVVPQGTLAERMRAGGAGIGGFYTPTATGTALAKGKETRIIDGKEYVLESPLKADFGFVRAQKADKYGNLFYHLAMRTFNPLVAAASKIAIAEVDEIVEPGDLAPDMVHTPSVYVDRIVKK